jgi:hypothetical protein
LRAVSGVFRSLASGNADPVFENENGRKMEAEEEKKIKKK